MVTWHRQAKANALRRRKSARTRLGPTRVGEHELTDVKQRIVEIWVVAMLDFVELDVSNFGVARRAAHLRRLALDTVFDAAARLSKACNPGLSSYSSWASVTTRAGSSRMLPSSFSRTMKRWLGCPGRTTRLRSSVSMRVMRSFRVPSNYSPLSHNGYVGDTAKEGFLSRALRTTSGGLAF